MNRKQVTDIVKRVLANEIQQMGEWAPQSDAITFQEEEDHIVITIQEESPRVLLISTSQVIKYAELLDRPVQGLQEDTGYGIEHVLEIELNSFLNKFPSDVFAVRIEAVEN